MSKGDTVKLLPCGPLHGAAHIICQLASPGQMAPEKSVCSRQSHRFCIFFPEVISQHFFFHSLLFRGESLNPAYAQGKENKDLLLEGKKFIACVYMLFSSPTEI